MAWVESIVRRNRLFHKSARQENRPAGVQSEAISTRSIRRPEFFGLETSKPPKARVGTGAFTGWL